MVTAGVAVPVGRGVSEGTAAVDEGLTVAGEVALGCCVGLGAVVGAAVGAAHETRNSSRRKL